MDSGKRRDPSRPQVMDGGKLDRCHPFRKDRNISTPSNTRPVTHWHGFYTREASTFMVCYNNAITSCWFADSGAAASWGRLAEEWGSSIWRCQDLVEPGRSCTERPTEQSGRPRISLLPSLQSTVHPHHSDIATGFSSLAFSYPSQPSAFPPSLHRLSLSLNRCCRTVDVE